MKYKELKSIIKKIILEEITNDIPFPLGGKVSVFVVQKPIKVYRISGPSQPTNAYYGNAQIYEPSHESVILQPNTELHWIFSGVFSVMNNKVVDKILLFEPKRPFEKSYGEYKDLWFKQHVNNGDLRMVGEKKIELKYKI